LAGWTTVTRAVDDASTTPSKGGMEPEYTVEVFEQIDLKEAEEGWRD
jgi:hypothetical protein